MSLTRATLGLGLLAALGEAALLVALVPRQERFSAADPFLFAFFVGPPAFLALIAWRRRAAPPRPRLLFVLALGVAAFGIAFLLQALLFQPNDPARPPGGPSLLLLPIVQWPPVLAAWLWLVARERKRP